MRGPWMCSRLREFDWMFNIEKYPLLCYPDIYVLDGGYCQFFNNHSDFCEPKNYIKMED